jgi:hypothetical protein
MFKFAGKGDTLIGKFVRQGVTQIKGKDAKTFTFDCGEAGMQRILGGAQLDEALMDAKPGQVVCIVFSGQTKSGSGMNVNQFEVGISDSLADVTLGIKNGK